MAGEPEKQEFAEALFQTITQPLLVLDGDLKVAAANPAFCRHFGVDAAETEGQKLYDLGNGQWDTPSLRRLLEEVLTENGSVGGYRVEHEFETIGKRIMRLYGHRMKRNGAADRILLAIEDVTEHEDLLFELEGGKEFAEKLIDSIRESLLVLDLDLRVRMANRTFYDHFRVTPGETVGRTIGELGDGQWNIPELRERLESILPDRSSFDDFEVEQDFANIGRRTLQLNGRRLDHMERIVLSIRDITEQSRSRTRQRTLTNELQHRVKNILSNVSALAIHTRRGSRDIDDFIARFDARLAALGRAQDLLVKSPSEPAVLRDIVRLELGAVGAEEGRHYVADGPMVLIRPDDIQPIAMTLHELTTNAARYGALQARGARVEITWFIELLQGQRHLNFHWRERGVIIEDTEPEGGFGSRVIRESLPHITGGSAELTIHPDGAECRLVFPLERQV